MTRFFAEPPQGHEDSQQLRTVGGPSRPYIRPPQGLQSEEILFAAVIMAYEVDWFNVLFLKRIPLTINGGQVPTTQINFPLLINDTFSDLIGFTVSELRFAGTDNTQLDYEIQKFDGITGELIAWVKKPTVSNGDMIFIYYDNSSAIDEQNPAAVWDVNYKSVYHMQSDGTDSTGNAQNLTQFGTAATPVLGKIGNGADYDGTVNDYSIKNPYAGFPLNEITAEYWVKSVFSAQGMISYAIGGPGFDDNFLTIGQEDFDVFIVNSIENTAMAFDDGQFHHIVITWRSSDGQIIVYIDGASAFSSTHQLGASFTDNGSLVLGQDQDSVGGGFQAAMSLDGVLDEVRLSDNFRSADYITTTFNNQNNPSAFYSTGVEENVPVIDIMAYEIEWLDLAWAKRIPLSINASQIPTTQNNFPLLINSIFTDLIGETEAELRFTGINNVQLEYEIQKFDNVTGELIAWVKMPTISDGDIINIYYDNPVAIDEQNPSAVWDVNYKAVYHLNNSFLDSTSNNNDGTNNGSSDIAGQIGQARDFDGIDDFLEVSDSASLNITNTITLSAWIKSTSMNEWIFGKDNVGANRPYSIRAGEGGSPVLRFGIDVVVPTFLDSVTLLSLVNFNYVVATYDGSQMKVYVNGVLDNTFSLSGSIDTASIPLFIGKRGDNNLHFDGIIDEPRISGGIARSADWITTEYNNQNNPGVFYSIGTVETPVILDTMGYEN